MKVVLIFTFVVILFIPSSVLGFDEEELCGKGFDYDPTTNSCVKSNEPASKSVIELQKPEPTCGIGTQLVDGICQIDPNYTQEMKLKKSTKFIDLKTLLPENYEHREDGYHEEEDYKYMRVMSSKDGTAYTVYLWQSSNAKDLPDRLNYQISMFYGNTFIEKYQGLSGKCWLIHTGIATSPEGLRITGSKSMGCVSNNFAFLVIPLIEDPLPLSKLIMAKIDNSLPSSLGGGCLIATATFGSELAPQVQQLREIRDNSLLQTESGTNFMNIFNDFYYSFSPVIADYERENPAFKEIVKIMITPMLSTLSIMTLADSEDEVLGLGISIIALNLGIYVASPVFGILKLKSHIQRKLN